MDHITAISGNFVRASEGKLQNLRNRDILDLQYRKGALYLIYVVISRCPHILTVSVRDKLFFQIYQAKPIAAVLKVYET